MDADERVEKRAMMAQELRKQVLAAIRATGAGPKEIRRALTQILGASIGGVAEGAEEERDAGVFIAAQAIDGCSKDQALIVELGFYRGQQG